MASHDQAFLASVPPTDQTTSTTTPSSNLTAGRKTIKIGTRKSALAMVQAENVQRLLSEAHPSLNFEVHAQNTAGDKNKITPLHAFGSKALWTKELEVDLLDKSLDLVVHCLKDMPTILPPGCEIGCILDRADPRDCVVMKKGLAYKTMGELPAGAIVGTSSVRRIAQGKKKYPHLVFKDVRGNIDTRLKKLDNEDYHCLILAAAGLLRMDYGDRVTQFLDSKTEDGPWLYAVGQGALAIETRTEDEETLALLRPLVDHRVTLQSWAERSLMRTLEGGCSIPLGVEAEWIGEKQLQMKSFVSSVDGTEYIHSTNVTEIATVEEAISFGEEVAKILVEKGAQPILDTINATRDDSKKY